MDILYFTADIIIAIVTNQGFINIIEKVLQEGIFIRVLFYNHVSNSGGHMWFLLALFVVSLIHYLFIQVHLEKIYLFLPLLVIVFLFFGVYIYFFLGKVASLDEVRNAIFLGLPCFAIGYDTNFLYKNYLADKNKKLICLISFAGGFDICSSIIRA